MVGWGGGGSPRLTFAERILANTHYIPKRGHAATLWGQLKYLPEDHPTYKTVRKAFEKAGGKRKLHESYGYSI